MIKFTKYFKETGMVKSVGFCSFEQDALHQETNDIGILLNQKLDSSTQYVKEGEPKQRPIASFDKTSIVADGTDTATLSGLPDSCNVQINGVRHEVTGGTLELMASMPGTYRVVISDEDAFPAQAFEATVEAT